MIDVLIVDDDPDIRELVRFKLLQSNLVVETASDGHEGLIKAVELRPAVVLLDVMMPRMSGIELCAELRRQPETALCSIVLLTAKAQEADIERGFAAGADDYIVKPFSPRDLAARVDLLLHKAGRVA